MTPPTYRDFILKDGALALGGIPVERLAARVGTTPFYAYDRGLITSRVRALKAVMPQGMALSYAIKANPMPALVDHMARLVDKFDVASAAEMAVALDSGMPTGQISFAGPGKDAAELARAAAAGVVLHLESTDEADRLASASAALGVRPLVAVRVNPDFALKASGMHMGGGPRQFGVDAEKVPEFLRQLRSMPVEFIGFHVFAGSQNLSADSLRETQEKTIELAADLARAAPAPVRHLNIGGGFGIPYFPNEHPLDIAELGTILHDTASLAAAAKPLKEARLVVELGRFLVGEAGVYVCRVIERKESRGRVFLITDGGLHHHLAASGNFGQVIRKNYPVAVANRIGEAPAEAVDVVGRLCTPLDILASKYDLPRAEAGDLIAVFQSGAYGLTASPARFLSHPGAPEVLVGDFVGDGGNTPA